MLPKHLILCRPLLLLPSIFPASGFFASESALCIRWPKYWSFSFSIILPVCTQLTETRTQGRSPGLGVQMSITCYLGRGRGGDAESRPALNTLPSPPSRVPPSGDLDYLTKPWAEMTGHSVSPGRSWGGGGAGRGRQEGAIWNRVWRGGGYTSRRGTQQVQNACPAPVANHAVGEQLSTGLASQGGGDTANITVWTSHTSWHLSPMHSREWCDIGQYTQTCTSSHTWLRALSGHKQGP